MDCFSLNVFRHRQEVNAEVHKEATIYSNGQVVPFKDCIISKDPIVLSSEDIDIKTVKVAIKAVLHLRASDVKTLKWT